MNYFGPSLDLKIDQFGSKPTIILLVIMISSQIRRTSSSEKKTKDFEKSPSLWFIIFTFVVNCLTYT